MECGRDAEEKWLRELRAQELKKTILRRRVVCASRQVGPPSRDVASAAAGDAGSMYEHSPVPPASWYGQRGHGQWPPSAELDATESASTLPAGRFQPFSGKKTATSNHTIAVKRNY